MARGLPVAALVVILWLFTGCGGHGDQTGLPAQAAGGTPEILLFNGTGTSPNDVKAFEAILKDQHANYSKVNSSQLNQMSEAQLREHRLLIVPGGNFITIGNGLNRGAIANIRNAVQNGLNYLGVCAGAFLAGNCPSNGLNLTAGVKFGFYAAEDRGIRKTAVPIAVAGATTLDHYWEDGPQLTGWGAVVGNIRTGPRQSFKEHAAADG
jgi:hypothetical protein